MGTVETAGDSGCDRARRSTCGGRRRRCTTATATSTSGRPAARTTTPGRGWTRGHGRRSTVERLAVTGDAWFDHQWGDFIAVGGGGWDWFAVNLDDGTDLTLSLVRDADGSYPLVYGTLVDPDGTCPHLARRRRSASRSRRAGRAPRPARDLPRRLARSTCPAEALVIDLAPTVAGTRSSTRGRPPASCTGRARRSCARRAIGRAARRRGVRRADGLRAGLTVRGRRDGVGRSAAAGRDRRRRRAPASASIVPSPATIQHLLRRPPRTPRLVRDDASPSRPSGRSRVERPAPPTRPRPRPRPPAVGAIRWRHPEAIDRRMRATAELEASAPTAPTSAARRRRADVQSGRPPGPARTGRSRGHPGRRPARARAARAGPRSR